MLCQSPPITVFVFYHRGFSQCESLLVVSPQWENQLRSQHEGISEAVCSSNHPCTMYHLQMLTSCKYIINKCRCLKRWWIELITRTRRTMVVKNLHRYCIFQFRVGQECQAICRHRVLLLRLCLHLLSICILLELWLELPQVAIKLFFLSSGFVMVEAYLHAQNSEN